MKPAALLVLALAAQDGPPPDRNPGALRMALVSMKSVYTDGADAAANRAGIESNLKRHGLFIDRAAAEGAEFVGFPELSVNGYHFSATMTWLSLEGPEVGALAKKAREKGLYVGAGIAEQDSGGRRWNTQVVLGPDGKVAGRHRKIWLTKEKGFVEAGTSHDVFEVKGAKMGIVTCADGTDRKNLQALAEQGAKILYGPHANTTGGTLAGWYRFRAAWGGPEGWISQLRLHAALVNQAGMFHPDFDPSPGADANAGWAGGAWFIGPDGRTLAQVPSSTRKEDSREAVLVWNVPLR
jgi:predicted amidohydrolase